MRENAEPNLDLVHPGSVFWGVMKDNPVGWITEKRGSGFHRGEKAGFAFDTPVDIRIRVLSDIADERLGLVCVEIIDHEMPLHDARVRIHRSADMSEEIRFIAG